MDGSEQATRLEAEARFDRWVSTLGGFSGTRFGALYREALEFAGSDGAMRYLDMAQQVDEDHAAGAGKWLAAEIDLANTRRATRLADTAAAATLKRVTDIKLAADRLAEDPRLADAPDFGTRPSMTPVEVAAELRFAMGLANRAPTLYEEMLPPVGDLARMIGVKS